VPLLWVSIPAAAQFVKTGKLKALAVSTLKRTPAFPDVPTVHVSGQPEFEVDSWYAMFVPAKTPRTVIERLNRALNTVLAEPLIRERLLAQGADAVGGTPDALGKVVAAELQQLQTSAEWQDLPELERNRIGQALQLPLAAPSAEPVERSKLLEALQQRSLASRAELAESLPTRFGKARSAAAKALEPNIQPLKLSSGVLKDEAALDAWWASKRQELLTSLQTGPIQIN
jgi:hypothetical protein